MGERESLWKLPMKNSVHWTHVKCRDLLRDICGHENNIGMDIKHKAERQWNAFTCQADDDVGPVARPGFTQRK
jgi:hypothetical protein